METYDHSNWHGTTGGTPWMQRTLLWLFRFIPIGFFYAVTALVIPFYMLFDRRGYRASYAFYRKRLGRGPLHSFLSVYANEFKLGQVVMDRFALYAGRKFDMQVDGMPEFERLSAAEPGFVQVSSHVGNYEMAGYTLQTPQKRMYALVFAGEKETVMQQRALRFGQSNIEMVPIAGDMSHLFTLNAALLEGSIVSMPGDRIFGSQKSITCRFFDAPAQFPTGPFLLAAQRSVAMLAVFVMKEGPRRYQAYVRPVGEGIDAGLPARVRAEAMASSFAGLLEEVVRRYPTQWFNFYDFWK